MLTLEKVARQYEDLAEGLDGVHAANDNVEVFGPEVGKISENISAAVMAAKVATEMDLSHAEVKNLPGDVAGQYNLGTDKISADEDIVLSGDGLLLAHVLTHEAWHQANKANGDSELIENRDFEEALTEAATAETTGQVIAYHEFAHMVDDVALVAELSRTQVVKLFKDGENERLNALHDITYKKAA